MFNPDDLALTKPEILNLIDETLEQYKGNKKVTAAGFMLKTFVKFAKADEIEGLWNAISLKINRLTIKNSLKHAKLNNESWAETFEKIEDAKN